MRSAFNPTHIVTDIKQLSPFLTIKQRCNFSIDAMPPKAVSAKHFSSLSLVPPSTSMRLFLARIEQKDTAFRPGSSVGLLEASTGRATSRWPKLLSDFSNQLFSPTKGQGDCIPTALQTGSNQIASRLRHHFFRTYWKVCTRICSST